MQDNPSSGNYQTLPFTTFGSNTHSSGGDDSAPSLADRRVVSRYHVDVYGRPRILSRWEIILHALAWPVVVGVLIGYMLAISLFVIHNFSMLKMQKTAAKPPVESQEASS